MSNNIEYIHLHSMGDIDACNAQLKTLPQALEEQFSQDRIEGYLFHLIYNQESIIEKLIYDSISQKPDFHERSLKQLHKHIRP